MTSTWVRTLSVVFGFVVVGFAQSDRGNISGVVTDQSGGAVPGATITVVHVATKTTARATTTATGAFNVPSLQVGEYKVEASAPGFKGLVQTGVILTAGRTAAVNAQLEVGDLTQTVEVAATAVQVQTEDAKATSVVQNQMMDQLPLVVGGAMRSAFNLVGATPEGKGGGETFSLGGGQARGFDVTLDGVSVTTNRSAYFSEIGYLSPSLDSVTQFAVDTSGFKAEYGHAGGGVITFVSKSGTNELHGSAYDFLRNDKLDARNFFEQNKMIYRQNDFGATLGGPVYLPKLYNGRNRTFFFVSYEGFRNRQGLPTAGATGSSSGGGSQTSTVPTPEMYEGDFSRWVNASGNLLLIYDPNTTSQGTRIPFSGNQIPKNRFSSFAKTMIPYGSAVKPNAPGIERGGLNWIQNNFLVTSGSLMSPQDKGGVRLDHSIGQSHRLGFFMNVTKYRQETGPGGVPGIPLPLWTGNLTSFNTKIFRVSHDWVLSPTMLSHLDFGLNLFHKLATTPNVGLDWKAKGVCILGTVDCNRNFPQISFSEFSGWGAPSNNGTDQPTWSVREDFSVMRGSHSFKFGYTYVSQRAYGIGEQNISGSLSFNRLSTSVPGQTAFNSGSSFASFLLGEVYSGNTQTSNFFRELFPYHGFYAQDDWRVTKSLVLNLGLRYDFTLPPVELNDQYSDLDLTLANPKANGYPGALIFAGFGPGRQDKRRLTSGWWGGIGPRIGLAYALNSSTTIRSGFGLSYGKASVAHGYGNIDGFSGSYSYSSPDQGITSGFKVDDGFPSYPLPPLLDPSFSNNQSPSWFGGQNAVRMPANYSWTYSMQRQVTPNMVLEASYNANVGAHLRTSTLNPNQVPTAYLNQFIQQYGAAGAINLLRSDINSAAAKAAGIPIPYANFTDPKVQTIRTVAQALRPFPQYQGISSGRTADKTGHSSYHALVIKADRRLSRGLTFMWSYALSKSIGDADDNYGGQGSQDTYNRILEKSISQYDQTHAVKFSTIFELPFGRGRRWRNSSRLVDLILGQWRLAGMQTYYSGVPMRVTRNNPFPISNGTTRPVITSYDNWRAQVRSEKFDPAVDSFVDRTVFPTQPNDRFGNVTRYNPKLRTPPDFSESVSIAKQFEIHESFRLDLRVEAFNLLNRVTFGTADTNLDSLTFGKVTSQSNSARQMQVGLKLYW